jgi:protein SCO1
MSMTWCAKRALPAAFLLLFVLAALAGCGSSGSSDATAKTPRYSGAVAAHLKPAPPLKLNDSLGKPVDIKDYSGKAVLVTFIYDHCPDICPTIVGNLHTAQQELGPKAGKLRIVAVSVDPKGDTPKTVRAFLKLHQMTGRMQYLIGSRPQLEKVWSAWHIVSKSSPSAGVPDAVEHSALIYGISGSGKLTTLYPANFKPAQIVHDVPLLASS